MGSKIVRLSATGCSSTDCTPAGKEVYMAEKPKYYDGQKLLAMKDINGKIPEIFICTANRTAGKSTWFNRKLVNDFKKYGRKFALIYRYQADLESCAEAFFKDIGILFFRDDVMTQKERANGKYVELFLNDIPCGYGIPMSKPENIKKYAAVFSDVYQMLLDEFMLESGLYLKDEVAKLHSIHTSIARGNFEQVRYVPLFLVGNPVSILNPYYVKLGISKRLKSDTKFLRGDGFVLEQGYNDSAMQAQMASGFNRAMLSGGDADFVAYAAQGVYLNDNQSFIDQPKGKSRYIATLRYEGRDIGIRVFPELNIVYADNRADLSFPIRVTVKTEDHDINYVMLRNSAPLLFTLRWYFERGCFRFKDLLCKECILTALSL